VFCGEGPCEEIGFYLVFIAWFEADEFCGNGLAIEASPGVDDLFYGGQQVGRCEEGAWGLSGEVPLGEVVGEARGVIHVAVREQNVVYGDDLVGGFADVETDIELRNGDDGFFAGDGVADDLQILYLYGC